MYAKNWKARTNVSELLLNTAIEHRLMHAETLAYMLHQLPLEKKIRQTQADVADRGQPRPETIEIPEGRVTLGLSRDDREFGWDNEYEAHSVSVPAFAIDRYKVTNGQYLEFMRAGGYQDRSSVDARGLGMEIGARRLASRILETRGRFLASLHYVRRDPVAAFLAGVCEPGRSVRLRPLGRQTIADRSRMAARNTWI